jgi:hypothetical protein
MKRILHLAGLTLSSMIIAGALPSCAVEAAQPTSSNEATASEGILYTIELGGMHRFEFVRLVEGGMATREMGGVDDKPLFSPAERPNNLSEVFHLIKPNDEVPAVLVEADRLHAEAAANEAKKGPTQGYPPPPSSEAAASSGPEIASSQQAVCSSDIYGDHWYGDHWYNNVVVGKPTWAQHWDTNILYVDAWITLAGNNFHITDYEGDLNSVGQLTLQRWGCDLSGCLWRNSVNQYLGPAPAWAEWTVFWAGSGLYNVNGLNYTRYILRSGGQCSHMHYLVYGA